MISGFPRLQGRKKHLLLFNSVVVNNIISFLHEIKRNIQNKSDRFFFFFLSTLKKDQILLYNLTPLINSRELQTFNNMSRAMRVQIKSKNKD